MLVICVCIAHQFCLYMCGECTYVFFFILFSLIDYYIILSIVTCAYVVLVIYSIYIVYMFNPSLLLYPSSNLPLAIIGLFSVSESPSV